MDTTKSTFWSGAGLKAAIVLALAVAVGAVLYAKNQAPVTADAVNTDTVDKTVQTAPATSPERQSPAAETKASLPRLVDLGAGKCIPCKMMAPILEELKKTYAGKLDVVFIDVWEKPDEAKKFSINLIPTQIFFDAAGTERFRHEGFYSREDILAKWKELGVDLGAAAPAPAPEPAFSRLDPAVPDSRPKESTCYMCDGDVNPQTRALLKTEKGDVRFCSPHCYFIMCSSMVPPKNAHDDASMTDWATGAVIPAATATYVRGMDTAGRPVIKAFADPAAAAAEQQAGGGNVFNMVSLQEQEMATLCGFCDRAVYPVDACAVKVAGLNTWGCCTMCALGVAARMQKDIEVAAKDALSGEAIRIRTASGQVSILEPASAVAWAGSRKDAEGKLVSTGCFKQAFFVNEDNLKKWVEAHPAATGRAISINQALAEKMKLSAEQISKACKIGECAPK
jgi:thioredoxin 1